jgi:Dyp-type peroxidase family
VATSDLNGGRERKDIQGLLASGYGHLSAARYLLLGIADSARAGAWLDRLAAEVTHAGGKSEGEAVNVALGLSGISKLGLPRPALGGFSARFLEGMTLPYRSRALGDVECDAPERWAWGGPGSDPIDVLLLLYAEDDRGLDGLEQRLIGDLPRNGLTLVQPLDTVWSDREHFGFRDGISQPAVEGLRRGPPLDVIKAGEFVLGYPNEYGLLTERPLVRHSADPRGILPTDPASGDRDLGRNGSYLVFRQLSQDVAGFWDFVDRASSRADGGSDPVARKRLAAKLVGRWPNGSPLVLAPDSDHQAPDDANDFRYHAEDPYGLRCPLGAHVRRTHPRDALDPMPGSDRSVAVDKRHRLLRRGRAYGSRLSPEEALNGVALKDGERGLHFICLCANIARQFEFVHHTWANNRKFAGLYDESDPLLGRPGRAFTLQAEPVGRRVRPLPSFVGVRGGGYFFLPGLRALRYLASLPAGG